MVDPIIQNIQSRMMKLIDDKEKLRVKEMTDLSPDSKKYYRKEIQEVAQEIRHLQSSLEARQKDLHELERSYVQSAENSFTQFSQTMM